MSVKLSKKDLSYKPIIFASALAFIIVSGLWLWAYFSLIGESTEARGTFGDMFGGVNALFSGWAFAGVVIAFAIS